jgi:outer membrane protein assembly factor BamB
MDFGFDSFDSTNFGDFDVEIEDVQVKKTRKYDRIWKVGFGGSICGRPLFHNGMAIFGSMDHHVYAIDMLTREIVWRFKASDVFLDSSAILSGNSVLIGSFDGNLYCLDVNTGQEVWRFKTGDKVNSTAFISDGKAYFGSKDGYVYCLDTKGKLVWRYNTGDAVTSSPVVVGNNVIVGSFSCCIYCLNKEDGREVWRFKTGGEIENDYPFLVHNGILYFGSFDNNLYAIDIRNGRELWRFRTGKYGNCGIPTLHDDALYYGSRDGTLFALSLDGKELWRFQTEKEIIDKGPLVYKNRIYFGAGDGNMYCLNTKGKELWRFRASGGIYTSVVEIGDVIYFGSWDCHFYAVDPNTGKEIWRFQTSTATPAFIPNPFECFKMEVTKSSEATDPDLEDKYKEKKSKSGSLSNYSIKSDYATTSDYKTKSDYDTNFVMIEESKITEVLLWNSDLTALSPQGLAISM